MVATLTTSGCPIVPIIIIAEDYGRSRPLQLGLAAAEVG